LLPQILGGPVTYHDNSRRLYVGSVAVHFAPQITNSNPATLVLNFTSPVNPRIATEPGHVSMRFTREPLVAPSSPTITLESKTIPSVAYQESNGGAEITVNTHAPLFVSFSNDGRTITLSTVAQFKDATPTITAPAGEIAVPPPPPPVPLTYFAVVDASHGGDENGATLSPQLLEKDVTLALAQRLSQQLEAKGLPTLVLRDGDIALTLDQRAQRVNQAHPKIYLSIHASSLGHGARIFTGWLPPGTAENSGAFLDWNLAQAGSIPLSRAAAASLAHQLQNAHINTRVMEAPLRPLNNIASPAIAVEIAPPASDVAAINSSEYQTQVATEVAAALAAMRSRLEAGQ
jgi:N-acetylmuramoyl-L-alanine amidase